MKTLIITAAALAGISGMNISHADSELPSVVIHYGAGSLGSGQGAAALYQKLKMAARAVCRADQPGTGITQRVASPEVKHCIDVALATAVARIDVPVFSAYASAQGGVPAGYIVAHQ